MRRIVAIVGLVFIVLGLAGAGYVLLNFGKVSAGYAVVPFVLGLACLGVLKMQDKEQ